MKLIINTDGGARGNPGPAAIGVVIKEEDGRIVKSFAKYLGVTTNNQAEYIAVLEALKHLIENKENYQELSAIDFILDSELVVKQIKGEYRIKHPELTRIKHNIDTLIEQLFFNPTFKHVKREHNWEADKLVNIELNNQR